MLKGAGFYVIIRMMTKKYVFVYSISACVITVLGIFFLPVFKDTSIHASWVRADSKLRLFFAPKMKADILLVVKFDKQDHALSCEAAVLKMALAFRGVNIDEAELIKRIGYDNTSKSFSNGQTIWGDPQKGFVGSIDGRMMVTGYGVYWRPVAKVANIYRPSVGFENWKISDIAFELSRGNPVMVWGYLGSGTPVTWKTSAGQTVSAIANEHVFLVNGLKGTVENPQGFFVVDPIYGQTYLSMAEFSQKWDSLGRSGVAVY